jgi:hypothetical protein
MANHEAIHFFGQRFNPLLEGITLIRERKIGAVIPASAGNTPGD